MPIPRRLRIALAQLATLALLPWHGAVVAQTPAPLPERESGLIVWQRIHAVFSHPRCANCHVDEAGVPIWSGPGHGAAPRPHGMNVRGGSSRLGAESGLLCSTCHMAGNADQPHGPPGSPQWLLAPAAMQWHGRSSAEICAQIKDPARNGGRTLEQVAAHVDHDELVHWGWKPGPGREPAPGSSAATAADIRAWAHTGAPCPER